MNRLMVVPTVLFLLAVVSFTGYAEQDRPRIHIDPQADDALRKMSATLAKARSFSFRSVTTMDQPIATGQMAQFTRQLKVAVCRPNRIAAESHQGEDVWFLWYDGRELTLLDQTAKLYAAVQVPPQIEAMLDDIAQKYDMTLPLADMLFTDPYKVMTADAYAGRYVGLDDVGGIKCHHLLFTQEFIDWQIWIDAGKEPVPRKMVIDYKTMHGRPEFTAMLSDWNLSAPAKDQQFKAVLPKDAKKVEMAKLYEAAQGE
jgi:hypothetical protein